jgi:hypothetical protein
LFLFAQGGCVMISEKVASSEDGLVRHLSEQIQYRTWRRVRDLQVAVRNGQLVVEGKTPTYYVKQLALRAICDVVGTAPLAINIEVENNPRPLHLYEVLAG